MEREGKKRKNENFEFFPLFLFPSQFQCAIRIIHNSREEHPKKSNCKIELAAEELAAVVQELYS